ncbi:hypothetical protein BJ546DRAFT_257840 [Cryomyces antarcticus]|nr:hypothetical protein LTR04_000741 [Oleoguttula sp. CCFEE 6159]
MPFMESRRIVFDSDNSSIALHAAADASGAPNAQPQSNETVVANVEDVEDSDSDDDAPEAITASSALERTRAIEAEAAKAAGEQEAAAKRKRKQRDAKLREQAESSKRSRKRKRLNAAEDDSAETHGDATTTMAAAENQGESNTAGPSIGAARKLEIPALLPEEMLAAEPATRLPTPPPGSGRDVATNQHSKSKQKLARLEKDAKPPKDVVKGPVRLRVTERENKLLPPKANKQSKSLRESLLHNGRSGRRQTMNKGFNRK